METQKEKAERDKKDMFKSYYVVWKQPCFMPQASTWLRFKSYYVVWKPKQLNRFDTAYVLFKSYYVVWKLSHISFFSFDTRFRLNRTM